MLVSNAVDTVGPLLSGIESLGGGVVRHGRAGKSNGSLNDGSEESLDLSDVEVGERVGLDFSRGPGGSLVLDFLNDVRVDGVVESEGGHGD